MVINKLLCFLSIRVYTNNILLLYTLYQFSPNNLRKNQIVISERGIICFFAKNNANSFITLAYGVNNYQNNPRI